MMAPDEGMKNKRRILAAERRFRQPESWLRIQSAIFAKPASIGATVALYRVSGCLSAATKQKPRYPSNAVLFRLFSGFHLNHFHRKHGGFHARHIAAAQTRRGRGLLASGFGYQRGGIGFHKLQT